VIRLALVAPALALRLGLRLLLSADDSVEIVAEAATLAELFPLRDEVDALATEVEVLATEVEALATEVEALATEADVLILAADSTPTALPESALLPILLLYSGDPPDLPELHHLDRPWGLLPLESSPEELSAALSALREGLFVSPPALLPRLLANQAPAVQTLSGQLEESPGGELTGRESEVLALLAQGLANKQIAARMGISEHTVKFHVSAIYGKLGASSRTEAVRLGVRLGLIVL
jgi:DNA-binding NarL/FixJ family response regulator